VDTADGVAWFPSTQSRSGGAMLAIALVIIVETVGLHFWLHPHHPTIAWGLTALSVLALLWLARDYAALAGAGLELGATGCNVRIGRRARAQVPWTMVEQVRTLSWRDLPQPAADYLNAARPDDPNLLFTFQAPLSVRSLMGPRQVRQLGVRVADADRVVQHWAQSASGRLT
jgi:hypothetical protein